MSLYMCTLGHSVYLSLLVTSQVSLELASYRFRCSHQREGQDFRKDVGG